MLVKPINTGVQENGFWGKKRVKMRGRSKRNGTNMDMIQDNIEKLRLGK